MLLSCCPLLREITNVMATKNGPFSSVDVPPDRRYQQLVIEIHRRLEKDALLLFHSPLLANISDE